MCAYLRGLDTCGYIDGWICLSSELVDPDFPVLWEEMAASASGRLSSSSWLLDKTERSDDLQIVLNKMPFSESRVGLDSSTLTPSSRAISSLDLCPTANQK